MAENSFDTLSIYIDYDRLRAKDFASYLLNLSIITTKIAEDYFSRFNDYDGEELPSLDINTINTGNSIKLSFVEGWMPKISTNAEGDIVIGTPKKLGIPILVGYLIINIANGYQEFNNKRLDSKLKEIEIQLKQSELAKAISIKNSDHEQQNMRVLTANYLDNKIPEIKPVLLDTVKSILRNPDIKRFQINNIEIKNNSNQ